MVDLKILNINKTFMSKNPEDPFTGYLFVAVNQGGQKLDEMIYFCRPGNVKLKKDHFYRGEIVLVKTKDKNDRFEKVEQIDGWGELPDAFADTMGENEQADRDAYYMAFGDVHTAAPIVARLIDPQADAIETDQLTKDLLIHTALICRAAREELTKKYQEEKNGK